jgi:uncharacterized membrane protein YagU involved in acid resistance
MESNMGKGIVAGFVATLVLSVLMVMKAMMGVMPDMNAIRMLTGMAHRWMGTPMLPIVGWMLHFMIGSIAWGALFARLVNRIPGRSLLVKGMVFGFAAWLMMMILVMPMAGAGLFGLHLGIGAPMATLMLHAVFGAVLGTVYGRLVHAASLATA